VAALAGVLVLGCDERPLDPARADAGAGPAGLKPEQAAMVLARVGERVITLGDFAAVLERMNALDRPRYLNPEMRRKLLEEMIDVELLAQEARRRGLDKRPEVEEAIRQILREAALAEARRGMPQPADIGADKVRAYYERNAEQFREPERRRVSAIVLDDPDKAKQVHAKARALARPEDWGALFHEHSLTAPKERSATPADLVGELGIVGPPGDSKAASDAVPAPVQRAVFELTELGEVHASVVEAEGRYFVVRLSGRVPGHTRSLAEVERVIQGAILQELIDARERELDEKLRARFPVTIDEQALAQVKLPPLLESLWQERTRAEAASSAARRPEAPAASGSARAP
jgi:hypothetical protein